MTRPLPPNIFFSICLSNICDGWWHVIVLTVCVSHETKQELRNITLN